jgi:hypothetical protein
VLKTEWRIVNVVALPAGWSNEYDIGDDEKFIEPCPALLVQERHGQVRVVFAAYSGGLLEPAINNPLYHDSAPPYPTVKPPRRTGPPPTEKTKRADRPKQPAPRMLINPANRPDFTKMTPVRLGLPRGEFASPFFYTGGRLDGQAASAGFQPFVRTESGTSPEGDRLPDAYYVLFRKQNGYGYYHSTLLPPDFIVFPPAG